MAGLGRKVFTAGDVLTASDVQNYLMDQTVMNFAGTAARSSAIATPTTGMTTYNQTTQQLETYNGSAYVGMSGLQLIKKQTVGTGVSSVTVTGAFSTTYENYKIVYTGMSFGTGNVWGQFQFNSAHTTGYSGASQFIDNAGTVTSQGTSNLGRLLVTRSSDTSTGTSSWVIELSNPMAAVNKSIWGQCSGGNMVTHGGYYSTSSTFSQFVLSPTSGVLTGGTIYVYGYGV